MSKLNLAQALELIQKISCIKILQIEDISIPKLENKIFSKEEVRKLITTLTNFCENFTDEEIAEYNLSIQTTPLSSSQFYIPGYILLFNFVGTNKYKFKSTAKVSYELAKLEAENPGSLELIHTIKSNDTVKAKKQLREEFEDYFFYQNSSFENWFEFPQFVVDYLCSLDFI